MKILFLLVSFTLSTLAFADDCRTILTIETNDPIYPGQGEVQVCMNQRDQLTKLNVIKPVKTPHQRNTSSSQYDERNPVIQITVEEINSAGKDFSIMTPTRYGFTVTAAYLGRPRAAISRDSGGEVVLKVLKNKILGTYHYFRLKLMKVDGEFRGFLVSQGQNIPLSHAYFTAGVSGIKKVDFY